eukprot:COSAG05_NODE_1595_length_4458_cov_2.266116_1_plen_131_part_00
MPGRGNVVRESTGNHQVFRFHHFVGRSVCMLICTGLGFFLCMVGLVTLFSEVTKDPCVEGLAPVVVVVSGTTSADPAPEPEPLPEPEPAAGSWTGGTSPGTEPEPEPECHRRPRNGAVSWAWFAFGGSVV